MDGATGASIVSGCAVVITAIMKVVPSRGGGVCPAHSGLQERLKAGDKDIAEIKSRLAGLEKGSGETQEMVRQIHQKVMK